MRRFVIDANIAAKWYLPETDSALAERLLEEEAELHAPAFLQIEFASIIWKHSIAGNVSKDLWRAAGAELRTAIANWHPDALLLEPALNLAITHRHHVFDCLYLALAIQVDGIVVTADKQFLMKFGNSEFSSREIGRAHV